MSTEYTLQSEPVTLESATGEARKLLEGAQQSLGFVPNMYAGMARLPAVLSTYLHGYEQFRSGSGFESPEQEVVFLVISRENGCGYCTAAHSMLAENMSGVPAAVVQAVRDNQPIPDARLAALAEFVKCMFHTRGRPSPGDVQKFLDAGFQEQHILAIVLALAVKTLSNYCNHVGQPQVDDAFSDYA